ncbi:hypothetical protein [Streptomyces sp. ISL-86]|uniref:hypothetical protein n=1 Tax=Streptomyces sp. ISL-86 TaxID=2819187 RepID=UPI001BE92556|nr:hypothetical protein [Streptomyces sp. ISL-86]MBT2453674.1 hypothetical protein [Streptomyces sp. ISL-86]
MTAIVSPGHGGVHGKYSDARAIVVPGHDYSVQGRPENSHVKILPGYYQLVMNRGRRGVLDPLGVAAAAPGV